MIDLRRYHPPFEALPPSRTGNDVWFAGDPMAIYDSRGVQVMTGLHSTAAETIAKALNAGTEVEHRPSA